MLCSVLFTPAENARPWCKILLIPALPNARDERSARPGNLLRPEPKR
ncbi:MAG: hypothetical protein AB8H47_27965 [Bacteroidia bacterium]